MAFDLNYNINCIRLAALEAKRRPWKRKWQARVIQAHLKILKENGYEYRNGTFTRTQ